MENVSMAFILNGKIVSFLNNKRGCSINEQPLLAFEFL